MSYEAFLQSKKATTHAAGIDVSLSAINEKLFDFQKAMVQWALRKGRAAIFAECGLGKSFMQLEWGRLVHKHASGDVLILAPLAVAAQTVSEGAKLGIAVQLCRTQADVRPGLNITNYEMLQHFDASHFVGAILDESSLLKSFMGKTKRALVEAFANSPYRLCCTATPAPNDVMEIGNHAEFLGIMPSSEMLMRWFINDTMKSGHYRLKGHAVKDFWAWVASWGISLRKPSDLGYSDEGFVLPELHIRRHYVEVDISIGVEQCQLFRAPTMSATTLHKEMRLTVADRAQAVADLVNGGVEMDFVQARDYLTSKGYSLEPTPQAYHCEEQGKALWSVTAPGYHTFETWTTSEIKQVASQLKSKEEPWAIWCNTNYEQEELEKHFGKRAFSVYGSLSPEEKENRILRWLSGERPILISKPSICGFGMNFQHCHKTAFVGLSYSFEQFYQAVRRFYRFGQTRAVEVVIVAAETESTLVATLERKMAAHLQMAESMNAEASRLSLQEDLQLSSYHPQIDMILPSWLKAEVTYA